MTSHKNLLGSCLEGRYQLEALLGQGGMSHVYLAEDLKLKGKKWAVKECFSMEEDRTSFLEEAEMLAQLQHPQLPQLVDYFMTEAGQGFLVMDYIQGPTLQDLFEEKGRILPVSQIVHIAFQLCDLFHYLHSFQPRPIIFRDLKPSNVMLNEHGQVRLIDFGVARHFHHEKQSDTVQMGTLGFAAPEQFLGVQTDARSDLFTLGAMLYYLYSGGQFAYITQKPLELLCPDLPEVITSTVGLLLQEHPHNRCQSAMEVKMRLRTYSSNTTIPIPNLAKNDVADQTAIPEKLIIIGSLFAGVGSTFAAISLSRLLHALRIPNALVEHPVIEPDLYMLLYGDTRAPKGYQFSHSIVKDQQAPTSTVWTDGYSSWFPIHPDGLTDTWQSAESFKLLHTIKKPIVIWDVSTHWEEASVQELCHSADEIIVVLDGSPGKCNRPRSRSLLEKFETYQKRGKRVHLLANGNLPRKVSQEWVESLPIVPLCTIPDFPRDEVRHKVWRGQFIQDQPDIADELNRALAPLLTHILPPVILHKEKAVNASRSWISKFKKHG
ncbi:serine/threonine protein kinase [Paenibacillus sp. HWE-109]|uniref:serine/threonine protein kinase n=1 Tax=Paenibacillus sp. HWE-109 TaxID=1306526 RepID=UPI001EDFA41A|nr:serine/threonine-protein kinase [Paenibacillus sp. HWE-109]UKS29011.1 serine/threonine protein kinase [Paenibacillus sp. HWE-109]